MLKELAERLMVCFCALLVVWFTANLTVLAMNAILLP